MGVLRSPVNGERELFNKRKKERVRPGIVEFEKLEAK
jgi:hypothetical protein